MFGRTCCYIVHSFGYVLTGWHLGWPLLVVHRWLWGFMSKYVCSIFAVHVQVLHGLLQLCAFHATVPFQPYLCVCLLLDRVPSTSVVCGCAMALLLRVASDRAHCLQVPHVAYNARIFCLFHKWCILYYIIYVVRS